LEKETIWKVDPAGVQLVKFRGVEPVFAYGSAAPLFQPEAHLEQAPPDPEPLREEAGSPFVAAPGPAALPQRGVLLAGGTHLRLPAEGLLGAEGTVEFWLRPEWASSGQFLQKQQVRTVLEGEGWQLMLHRF